MWLKRKLKRGKWPFQMVKMPTRYNPLIEERSSWSLRSYHFTFVWNWNPPQSQPVLSSVPVTSLKCQSCATWNRGESKYLISSLRHLPCCMWPSEPKRLKRLAYGEISWCNGQRIVLPTFCPHITHVPSLLSNQSDDSRVKFQPSPKYHQKA